MRWLTAPLRHAELLGSFGKVEPPCGNFERAQRVPATASDGRVRIRDYPPATRPYALRPGFSH